jgi:hypothetical protein
VDFLNLPQEDLKDAPPLPIHVDDAVALVLVQGVDQGEEEGLAPVGEDAVHQVPPRLLVQEGGFDAIHQGKLHLEREDLKEVLPGEEDGGPGLEDLVLQHLQDPFRKVPRDLEGLDGVLGPESVGPPGVFRLGRVDVHVEGEDGPLLGADEFADTMDLLLSDHRPPPISITALRTASWLSLSSWPSRVKRASSSGSGKVLSR